MKERFERARKFIPGGVNSPVRAFGSVGGTPVFIESASGCRITDADGREYIDYVGSWGPMIAGHAHPRVVQALREQVGKGTSFGTPCELETELAQRVCDRVPGVDRVRFVSSGTEATMSAVRLARGFTGRDEVVKIAGCYHGHVDSLLVNAGSGVMTLGIPGSPGIPEALAGLTRVIPFNDVDALRQVLEAHGENIACLILEPIGGNMGVVPPDAGYLEACRDLTREHGVTLIFDEVMTGFRVSPGGARTLYGVEPDLVCFGKVVGGGMPVGAYGGGAEIMGHIAPDGPVYQAGTLSGNPLAMRAGIETLDLLAEPGVYDKLEQVGAKMQQGFEEAAREAGVAACVNRVGSMLTGFFGEGPVRNYDDAAACDTKRYAAYFHAMLERGVYLAPSQFEAAFLSTAHGDAELDATAAAAKEAMQAIAR